MINILLLKKKFVRGDVIFKEGDEGTEAYIIRHGYVTISKDDDGESVELATRGPGEIVGEMSLIDDCPRSASMTAKTDVELEIMTAKDLKEMISHLPEPVELMLHQLLDRLRDTNELVVMSHHE